MTTDAGEKKNIRYLVNIVIEHGETKRAKIHHKVDPSCSFQESSTVDTTVAGFCSPRYALDVIDMGNRLVLQPLRTLVVAVASWKVRNGGPYEYSHPRRQTRALSVGEERNGRSHSQGWSR